MNGTRGLSPAFMAALQNDVSPGIHLFLDAVKKDSTLCLEIRDNFINIYYRGGNLVRVREHKGKYTASFDRKYILQPKFSRIKGEIGIACPLKSTEDVNLWINALPYMKQEMDWWFGVHGKEEREAQQLILRENNFVGPAKSTDYFICDIEYANVHGRFDLIAVHWPSTSASHKNNQNLGLALIELKYLDKSLTGKSGILDHIRGVAKYLGDEMNLCGLKEEMRAVFNQKLELGLIANQKPIQSFKEGLPELIFIFANHDPASKVLMHELAEVQKIASSLPFQVRCATSNFMGYGLYEPSIVDLKTFIELERQRSA